MNRKTRRMEQLRQKAKLHREFARVMARAAEIELVEQHCEFDAYELADRGDLVAAEENWLAARAAYQKRKEILYAFSEKVDVYEARWGTSVGF